MAPATLKDVAKRCGVSWPQLPEPLNNRSEASPITRAKRPKQLRKLGMLPARSLKVCGRVRPK